MEEPKYVEEREMGRRPCCSKVGLNRGAWSAHEDKVLREYITINGEGRWRTLPKEAGLKRCGKSCRLRWLNYLRPDIKRGNISEDEEELIVRLHRLLGNRWALIAGRLPGRTDNEIKNYWNTNLLKRVNNGRLSKQENNNSILHLPSNLPFPSRLRSKLDSDVVRTKATRCTKVVLNPQLFLDVKPSNINSPAPATPSDDGSRRTSQPAELHECNNEFLQPEFGEDDRSWDFMTDFDHDEVFLTDLLDADYFPETLDFSDGGFSFEPFSDEITKEMDVWCHLNLHWS